MQGCTLLFEGASPLASGAGEGTELWLNVHEMYFNWKAETQGTRPCCSPRCRASTDGDGAGVGAASEGCEEAVMNSHLILKHCILLLHVELRVCACVY